MEGPHAALHAFHVALRNRDSTTTPLLDCEDELVKIGISLRKLNVDDLAVKLCKKYASAEIYRFTRQGEYGIYLKDCECGRIDAVLECMCEREEATGLHRITSCAAFICS